MTEQDIIQIIGQDTFQVTWNTYLHRFTYIGLLIGLIVALLVVPPIMIHIYQKYGAYHWQRQLRFWGYSVLAIALVTGMGTAVGRYGFAERQPSTAGYLNFLATAKSDVSSQLAYRQLVTHWHETDQKATARHYNALHNNAKWRGY
jgi:hypothetical protein